MFAIVLHTQNTVLLTCCFVFLFFLPLKAYFLSHVPGNFLSGNKRKWDVAQLTSFLQWQVFFFFFVSVFVFIDIFQAHFIFIHHYCIDIYEVMVL